MVYSQVIGQFRMESKSQNVPLLCSNDQVVKPIAVDIARRGHREPASIVDIDTIDPEAANTVQYGKIDYVGEAMGQAMVELLRHNQ